jgi:hypothetical protein
MNTRSENWLDGLAADFYDEGIIKLNAKSGQIPELN